MAEAKKEEVKPKGPLGKIMEAVMPGGMSGILGEGAGTGALEGLVPKFGAPDSPTPDAPATGPQLPLGF